MHRRFVVALAVVAVSAIGIAGCKKQEGTSKEGPATSTPPTAQQTAPAPSPTQPSTQAPTATGTKGEALYKQYCAACHPNGGNTINPKKTLNSADMTANNVTKPEDVVRVMRNPGPGMNKFDASMVSDQDAQAIGEYVFATYNK